jgi:hypothetical protein
MRHQRINQHALHTYRLYKNNYRYRDDECGKLSCLSHYKSTDIARFLNNVLCINNPQFGQNIPKRSLYVFPPRQLSKLQKSHF